MFCTWTTSNTFEANSATLWPKFNFATKVFVLLQAWCTALRCAFVMSATVPMKSRNTARSLFFSKDDGFSSSSSSAAGRRDARLVFLVKKQHREIIALLLLVLLDHKA